MNSNPLVSLLGKQPQQNSMFGNMSGMLKQFNDFRQNPVQFLVAKNYNIPKDFNGSPQDLVQHLLNTNQMSQSQFEEVSSLAKQMQGMFTHR